MVQCVYYILKIALGFITPVRCGSKTRLFKQLQQNESICNFCNGTENLLYRVFTLSVCNLQDYINQGTGLDYFRVCRLITGGMRAAHAPVFKLLGTILNCLCLETGVNTLRYLHRPN